MDSGNNSDNGFGMDPKPPQSDIDAGQTKVGNKDAACPPGRVPSSTSATGALPRAPIPPPSPMGQDGSWPEIGSQYPLPTGLGSGGMTPAMTQYMQAARGFEGREPS